MPDPNTHIGAGLGAAWAAGKLLGLDTDYLIVSLVGALLASAREAPKPLECAMVFPLCRITPLANAVVNLFAVSFFSASATAVGVLMLPQLAPVGIPVAALIGFFGSVIIKSTLEFLARAWKLVFTRLGGSENDAK